MLFIFDDVWNEKFFQFLTFAKKSIVTSRFDIEDKHISDQYRCIPAKVRDLIHINIISLYEAVNRFSYDYNISSKSIYLFINE